MTASPTSPWLRLLVVLTATAMLTAACASGSDTESDSSATVESSDDQAASGTDNADSNDDAADADEPATEAEADSSASTDDGNSDTDAETTEGDPSMAASSPIGAFFADGGGFEAALAEYTARVEEEIVRCMAAQGFEFTPTGRGGQNPVEQAQNELSEREWTLEYGYGISTSFDTIAEQQATDPNADIIFSLTAGEREAWLDTLFGVDREGFGVDTGARPLEEQGCIGSSIIATGGQGPIEGLDGFGDAYEEGLEGIFDRTEMITAVDDWSQCMALAGYTGYSELDAPEDEIGDELGTITAPLTAALDEIDDADARALVEGDTLELEDLPGLDVDALRDLQARELATAITDLDCYDEHVRVTYEPLRDDFERGLIEEFNAELDALRTIGQ